MEILHYNMIVSETILETSEIEHWLDEKVLLIGNEDFDKYIQDNHINVSQLINDEEWSVIEVI